MPGVSRRNGNRTLKSAAFSRIGLRRGSKVLLATLLLTDDDRPVDMVRRRRLAREAIVAPDWHNEMPKLILDINDRIETAADERARVIIRKPRRALEAEP